MDIYGNFIDLELVIYLIKEINKVILWGVVASTYKHCVNRQVYRQIKITSPNQG